MPKYGWSVRAYLTLIMTVAIVAVIAVAASGFVYAATHERDEAVERMAYRAERAAATLDEAIESGRQAVELTASRSVAADVFGPRAADCTLPAISNEPFTSLRVDIVSGRGTVACTSDPAGEAASSGVHAGSTWFERSLDAAGTRVWPVDTDVVTGRSAIVVTAPFGSGADRGVVATFLHVSELAAELRREVSPNDRSAVVVADAASGQVISSSTADTPAGTSGSAFPVDRRAGEWKDLAGTTRFFSSADVTDTTWRTYVGADRAAVLDGARQTFAGQAVCGAVALALLGWAVWVLRRRVAGPLDSLTTAVRRSGLHTEGVRVEPAGTAELVELGHAFNEMAALREGHEAQLQHQTTHDPLTGLPNKLLFRSELDAALERVSPDTGCAALLTVGVDRFRIVNAAFGHAVGDRVLRDVAERLRSALEPGDLLARFAGGDEFVVLRERTVSASVVEFAERLRRTLNRPFSGPDGDLVLQASVGVALAAEPGVADQLLRESESALRQAKRTGEGWCVYDEALQTDAALHVTVEHDLRRAIEEDELSVHYQPLLDLATGRMIGAEALVRWDHPRRGTVSPVEFIPLAEETGLIDVIGRRVLEDACAQAATWTAAGHAMRVSVNVSAVQLRRADFPDVVQSVLREAGIPASQLCLEITESSLMRDLGPSANNLARLRAIGVHLAIDDFGTGYSSLAYLHELPVDELKIDRSFVNRISTDPKDQHLVQAIIGMARALDLTVVAEGIETSEHFELLSDLGCQLGQGYLFSRPQPAADLAGLLGRRVAGHQLVVE